MTLSEAETDGVLALSQIGSKRPVSEVEGVPVPEPVSYTHLTLPTN